MLCNYIFFFAHAAVVSVPFTFCIVHLKTPPQRNYSALQTVWVFDFHKYRVNRPCIHTAFSLNKLSHGQVEHTAGTCWPSVYINIFPNYRCTSTATATVCGRALCTANNPLFAVPPLHRREIKIDVTAQIVQCTRIKPTKTNNAPEKNLKHEQCSSNIAVRLADYSQKSILERIE